MVATPLADVLEDFDDDPVPPLTVNAPATVTDPTGTPNPFTTVAVTVPTALVLETVLTIVRLLTFMVVEVSTDRVSALVAERPNASATRNVGVNVPDTVGVPDSAPAEESDTPDGNEPDDSVQVSVPDPPVADSEVETAEPL